MTINYFDNEPISDVELEAVAVLAEQQISLQKQIIELEELVDALKKQHHKLSTETIPAAMAEIGTGLDQIKLKSGASISIRKVYYGSIKEENKARAFQWLRANDFEGLIKNTVNLSFGKGEDEVALRTIEVLKQLKIPYDQKEAVHPQTLKAFVREMLEKGIEIPLDLFGAGVIDTTVITLPKEK